MAIPSFEVIGRPVKRFVEMAQVAGIGPAGCEFVRDPGTADLMAANRLEDPVGGEGHVTVVTLTPAGCGRVTGVCRQSGRVSEMLVTLDAGPVVVAVARQLPVRGALMERMTGQTGKLASLIAGRFDQPVVVASGDPNHAVRPEEIAQQIGVAPEELRQAGSPGHTRGMDDRRGGFPIVPRPVVKSVFGPAFVVVPPLHRMTEPADLRSSPRVDFPGVNHLGAQGSRVRRWRPFRFGPSGDRMTFPRPVAGFA